MTKRGRKSRKNRNRNKFKNNDHMTVIKEERSLIAIYGNMRENGKDHHLLPKSVELEGFFYSEPIYKIAEKHGDAALFEKGKTSVLFEVYSVNQKDLEDLDGQHGYLDEYSKDEATKDYNFYNRNEIDTPFGKGFVYFYNDESLKKSESFIGGDWIESLKK